MHGIRLWLSAASLLIAGAIGAFAQSISPSEGVIRVKMQPEVAQAIGKTPRKAAPGQLHTGIATLDNKVEALKIKSIRPMFPYNEKYAEARAKYGLDRWYVVEFDESVSVETARKSLAVTPGIELSEAVTPMTLKEGNGNFVSTTRPPMKATAADYMFNDPRLPLQWHYQNYGEGSGYTKGADINLFEAWKVTTGNPDVVVAIIDGGIDYKHEDLAQNMYTNLAELNGTPGVDDDGNGYVDDIYGYNFCTNSADIYPHVHGTHVAGTVGAVNNNGLGVAGVAGGNGSKDSGVRLMSCQVFDSRSGVNDGDFAAALIYAAENGATIAQCSWGWDTAGYYEQAVLDAIDYFTDTARSQFMTGGLCIFAAGNVGETGNFYPAAYDKCVAVAAMTAELMPASYSNYGSWIDIIAPGGLLDYGESFGVLSTLPNNTYGYNEGTSMATPHVSGIAALVLSKFGSPTYVNESLRTQLTTSVNDFYGHGNNSRFEGLYGTGYIDAAKALAVGDGTAPAAVSDFDIAAAQDYVELTWIIPASSDNNVHHHIIYYSEQPFTATDDLSKVSSMVVDTKFLSSGEKTTCEIPNLKAKTTYYIAMIAVNRWGAASELSPVKSVTTNDGPEATVDKKSLSISSTAANMTAKGSFNIGNTADGILKWSSSKRTQSVSTFSVARPNIGKLTPYSGTIGSEIKPFSKVTAIEDYDSSDYPQDICYYSSIYAYIGDSDSSLPNSMAQWFYVDPATYPDGFNLTHVAVGGAYGSNPKIEIYKGDVAISSATKLTEVSYDFFVFGWNLAVNEQLYFAPGESFWVAVHFGGNQNGYPLGMARASVSDIQNYSYMSTDGGASWTQLAAALKGGAYENVADNMTWAITARCSNPDWSEVLTLSPASGVVRKGETQTVEVTADGSKLINGSYGFNIYLNTNQTENSTLKIPVTYNVSGNKPDLVVPKIVDFGSVLVGQKKKMTVEVYNRGYGSFRGSNYGAGLYSNNISSTSDQFAGPDYVMSGFGARAKNTVELTFCPTTAGSHTGEIVFTDVDGNTGSIIVHGAATEPAKVAVSPATIDAGTLNVGDAPVTKTFTLSNTGKYPLEFVFPRFSDETIDGLTAAPHKFGYTVSSTIEGYSAAEYDGNPALNGATDITSQFSDNNHLSGEVSFGFDFPFYGKTYDKAYITSFGGIMFAPNEEIMRTPLTAKSTCLAGVGLISAYGNQLSMGSNTKVEYAKVDGKFVVKFTNILAVVYDKDFTPISFHIAISANGDIEIYYDSYEWYMVFQNGSGLFCGIVDPEQSDAITVTSANTADYWGVNEPTAENTRFQQFTSGTAVKFSAPKPYFVTGLNVPYGIITPGSSVEITATMQATDDLNAGDTFNNLTLLTNDPKPDHTFVRFDATIDGESLVPVPAIGATSYDAGDVFRTSTVNIPVSVKNNGRRAFTINSVSFQNGAMSTTFTAPYTLEAGMAKDIVVAVPTTTEGAVADKITIATTAGDLEADLKANVIGCPSIGLSKVRLSYTGAAGSDATTELKVTNSGNETLRYAIYPSSLTSLTLPDNAEASTSYLYSFSGDDSSVKCEWEDIETTGLGTQTTMQYYILHDYIEVDLPFEFPFYGKKYSKMYIYNTGFVSFTKRDDAKIWPEPPGEFPGGTIYTNIIAPYWGLHSMDETKTAGTFHYVTDDKAVISFIEYGNSMNIGVDFQLIMHKDGTFKFQYKPAFSDAVIFWIFGVAGISDLDGNGISLPERMVSFNSAVEFSPVVESPVAPGASETIGIKYNTNRMAGTYTDKLKISTNIPKKESMSINISMTLSGEAVPVWPDSTVVEHVAGYISPDSSDPLVQMGANYAAYFTIGNSGTAYLNINNVEIGGTDVEGWSDEYADYFWLFYNGPEYDWQTGEPTGSYYWQQYAPIGDIAVGNAGLQFAIPMVECTLWSTPGEYVVPVKVTYNDTKTATFTVKFVVTDVPSVTFDKEQIYVKAQKPTDTFTESLTIGNSGNYDLKYSIRLDASGFGEDVPEKDDDSGISPLSKGEQASSLRLRLKEGEQGSCKQAPSAMTSLRLPAKADDATNVYDLPQTFEYINSLYYPANPQSTVAYTYGASDYDVFKSAVSYVAPEDGINISHIYTPVALGSLTNVDIKVEIISGANPDDGGAVLGKGSFHIAELENPGMGVFIVMPLDKSVYLNPGEEFCVVVTYPVGYASPAYLVKKEEAVVTGRYMGWIPNYGWFDAGELFKDAYGSLGFIHTCLETVKGEPWISFDGATEGTLKVGQTASVSFNINAAAARLTTGNKAVLVVKSNDPENPVVNFPIYLDLNGEPVISGPKATILVKEGETATATVSVADPDGDDVTVTFSDPSGNASVKAIEGATANEDGTYTIPGGVADVEVVIAPDFGSAGPGTAFTINATDTNGLYNDASFYYTIEHVNRAPVATEDIEIVEIPIQGLSKVVEYSTLFTDPDGDKLTYSVTCSSAAIEIYTSDKGVVFYGKRKASATAIVTATDPDGLSATVTLTLKVDELGSIDAVEATQSAVTVTPNPVDGQINAYCTFDASAAIFTLYDAAGKVILNVTAPVIANTPVVLDAAGLPQGIYLLLVSTDTASYTVRVIKK